MDTETRAQINLAILEIAAAGADMHTPIPAIEERFRCLSRLVYDLETAAAPVLNEAGEEAARGETPADAFEPAEEAVVYPGEQAIINMHERAKALMAEQPQNRGMSPSARTDADEAPGPYDPAVEVAPLYAVATRVEYAPGDDLPF
jgi:hypothetical protein